VKVLEAPLDRLSREASVFPAFVLREGGEGLCLFAARFFGINDAIHMARTEMTITLVDLSERVLEMAEMYGCEAHVADAWEYAEQMRQEGRQWDTVSADTFTGDPTTRSLNSLELWCSLARDAVACTHVTGQTYTVPDGWKDAGIMPRNPRNGANWLVLTRG
jgi:hypothetical protein